MTGRCKQCGKVFHAASTATLLCSDVCRRAHMRRFVVIDGGTRRRSPADLRLIRGDAPTKEDNDGRTTGRPPRFH